MTNSVAPPKVTGGGGFVFENEVCAHYLATMLSNGQPFGPAFGVIKKVAFQTKVDGWFLDDVLLTMSADKGESRISLSVKDRPVLENKALLSEFAAECWSQFLHSDGVVFDPQRDLLGLAIPPTHGSAGGEVDELLQLAATQSSSDLSRRLLLPKWTSPAKKDLWNRFACPDGLAQKYGVSSERTGELLKCVRIIQFDFRRPVSRDTQMAITICQGLLESGSPTEAAALWAELRAIADDARPRSGTFDLQDLLRKLASRYPLRSVPEFRADWEQMKGHTLAALAGVPATIGGRLTLPRRPLLDGLQHEVTSHRAVILIGSSGYGKTVLAKAWAEARTANSPVLWFNAATFDEPNFASVEQRWTLAHRFTEFAKSVSSPAAYVVIDGVDRLSSEEAFGNLRALLSALSLNDEQAAWRVVMTCQPEEWPRVQVRLLGLDLPKAWMSVVVRELDPTELEPVLNDFPQLRHLLLQRHLKPLLLNPKTLDVLASGIVRQAPLDVARWVGESDLIKWFWETRVSRPPNGPQRSAFLQILGERQADELQPETSMSRLQDIDLDPLDSLVHDGLCSIGDERLRFTHDMYGDWARERVLLSQGVDLSTYLLSRASSPLWNRAVRLFGLHLLEQYDTTDEWRSAMVSLGSPTARPDLIQDLLLEAVVIAADSESLLEKVWLDLRQEDGRLLRRLLGRFLHVATLPNPIVVAVAKTLDKSLGTLALTHARLPYWPYWLPMLRFLHTHAEDVTVLAPHAMAEISETWLNRGLLEWPLRKEAAELALLLGEQTQAFKQGGGFYSSEDGVDAAVYRAVLASARELPDRVKAFALEAAGRTSAAQRSSHG
jgi:hypothetical protein